MDRIVVKTNADMQRVIDWAKELYGLTIVLPFSQGEIEFREEEMLLKFRDEGTPLVSFELWLCKNYHDFADDADSDWQKCVSWKCDMTNRGISALHIHANGENRIAIAGLLAQDDTVGKCVRKFRALMLFAAYYREDVQRTRVVSRVESGKHGNKKKRDNTRMLTIRRYTIGSEMLNEPPAPKHVWKGYAESFGVRGHYRHYKNGKIGWVRPYEKRGRNEKRRYKEYIL